MESGATSAESGPVVIISELLANFFGTGEREMLHSEVLGRIWEYIKVNQLEVGNQKHDSIQFLYIEFYLGMVSLLATIT